MSILQLGNAPGVDVETQRVVVFAKFHRQRQTDVALPDDGNARFAACGADGDVHDSPVRNCETRYDRGGESGRSSSFMPSHAAASL